MGQVEEVCGCGARTKPTTRRGHGPGHYSIRSGGAALLLQKWILYVQGFNADNVRCMVLENDLHRLMKNQRSSSIAILFLLQRITTY